MSYGDSWEKYPIAADETWISNNGSKLSVCDLTKHLPGYMLDADMIYCDCPWSLGNVNMFNSKAGREYMNSFGEFYGKLFDCIREINATVVFLEIGKENKELFINELSKQYSSVQVWIIKYYNKHDCYLIRGSKEPTTKDYTGIDDRYIPMEAITEEKPSIVADMCTGRGITAMAAMKQNCVFVGTELNARKLAVGIERLNKKGYGFCKKI